MNYPNLRKPNATRPLLKCSKSMVIACLISAINGQTVLENCLTNSECETSLGQGACCLFEQDMDTDSSSYNCRNVDFVNYYYNPQNYDAISSIWTNPENVNDRMTVYCRPTDAALLPNKYPFDQPFGNTTITSEILYDQVNNNVRSDMFYVPRPVTSWGDQVLKWISAIIWFWTPIPSMIFINDIWWYVYDIFKYNGDPTTNGIKPSMYDNWFARIFM